MAGLTNTILVYNARCLIGLFASAAVISAGKDSQLQLIYTFPLGPGALDLYLSFDEFKENMVLQRNFVDHNNNVTETGIIHSLLRRLKSRQAYSC